MTITRYTYDYFLESLSPGYILTCAVVHLREVLVEQCTADGGKETPPVVAHREVRPGGFDAEEHSCGRPDTETVKVAAQNVGDGDGCSGRRDAGNIDTMER